ncbi:hypothetical protein ACLOJK_003959 [Asimina triloba]
MKKAASSKQQTPHVALLPSFGILRLVAALSTGGCAIILVAFHPTASSAESRQLFAFFSAMLQIHSLQLHLLDPFHPTATTPPPPSTLSLSSLSPFAAPSTALFLFSLPSQHQPLSPLLSQTPPSPPSSLHGPSPSSSLPPPSCWAQLNARHALVCIWERMMKMNNRRRQLHEHAAVSFHNPSSAPEYSLKIISSFPPPLTHPFLMLFTTHLISSPPNRRNGRALLKVDGVVANTLEALEGETLAALNAGYVASELPLVYSIGPLQPCEFENGARLECLDAQPAGSVIYVSFGSRTVLSREQLKELGNGLEGSGFRFSRGHGV